MASRIRCPWPGHAGLVVLTLVFAGCADTKPRSLPTQPAAEPGFVADSPVNSVRLLEWSWDHRDLESFSGLLTDDFIFGCAESDSAGNAFQGHGFGRIDEIESVRHLFVGGGIGPPASSIALQFDPNLIPQPGARAGKQDPTRHQEIATSTVLRISTGEEDFQVTGTARFFLVRGDVALIPAELTDRGVGADPGRWYIERWEDETVGSGIATPRVRDERRQASLRAQPAKMTTWCSIKMLYR